MESRPPHVVLSDRRSPRRQARLPDVRFGFLSQRRVVRPSAPDRCDRPPRDVGGKYRRQSVYIRPARRSRANGDREALLTPSASRRCGRRVDHGAVPVLDELPVSHPEAVERKRLVELAWLRRWVLPVDLVDHGDDVAFGGDDFERIALRWLWA